MNRRVIILKHVSEREVEEWKRGHFLEFSHNNNTPIALVEMDDGTVSQVCVRLIKFIPDIQPA